MGANSAIEWTDHTWNPFRGCRKVSQGCKNCYMFREQKRYGRDPAQVVRAAPATFNAPLRWKEPAMVFTCSWSDFFIKDADEWRPEAWDIIRRTPHLTYQILTKRTENIARRLPDDWGDGWPNVWLGASVENQEAMWRLGELAQIPARCRFISAEPLLGPLEFYSDLELYIPDKAKTYTPRRDIHWVIVGGESGPNARPMHPDWARSIRDQCQAAGVPFFFKQWGGVNKKAAGAMLDGREWREFPPEYEAK